jgi:hypothetical protein
MVARMTRSVDGRYYSAADQQAHQRGANYGSGSMPHDRARPSAESRSPRLPLSRGIFGRRLAARFRGSCLIRRANHYLLTIFLPYPRAARPGDLHDPLAI